MKDFIMLGHLAQRDYKKKKGFQTGLLTNVSNAKMLHCFSNL